MSSHGGVAEPPRLPRGDRVVRRRHRRRDRRGDRLRHRATPATCSASGSPSRLFGIGFGLVCWAKYLDFDEHAVEEREPLRPGRRPSQRRLHEELGVGRSRPRPPAAPARAARRVVRQHVHRVRRADRLARPEAPWRAGAHRVAGRLPARDRRRGADRADPHDVRPARHRVPRGPHRRRRLPGRAAAPAAGAAHRPHRRARRRRGLGRLLQDLHPRRLLGRAVRHRQPGSRTRCASSCARATSRSSTPSTAPGRSAARRRARSRSSPSTSTTNGFLVATAPFDRPVGPLAWDEA